MNNKDRMLPGRKENPGRCRNTEDGVGAPAARRPASEVGIFGNEILITFSGGLDAEDRVPVGAVRLETFDARILGGVVLF